MLSTETIDRLFPGVTRTPEEYEATYPPRSVPRAAIITRQGPSPTGFMHIGTVCTSLFAERIAHQTGGTFYLRIEDTDKKREMTGATDVIVNGLDYYGVRVDEGARRNGKEEGAYGPYIQSARKEIYRTFAKHLVSLGKAYPAFDTPEELEAMSKQQIAEKIRPGYYGRWAMWRDASEEKICAALDAGRPFVIRMRSSGNHEKKVTFVDLAKGEVRMPENDLDTVILKSEAAAEGAGLPTYHFAHVIDDHLMRTTHVIRTDEWFPSLPIHMELFTMCGWEAPQYCHPAPIQKIDGNSRRKLSKRKDPEANVEYYEKEGYPAIAVQEYLLNILNSNFEDWRKANPASPNTDFTVSFEKLSPSGALFDLVKLTDVSKEAVARMSAEEVYTFALTWAEKHDIELAALLLKDKTHAVNIFSIERGGDKTRKDISKWSDVKHEIGYFYDELFAPDLSGVQTDEAKAIVRAFLNTFNPADTKEVWLEKVRTLAEHLGYARDTKAYKASPEKFKGTLGQVTNVLRVLITGRSQSPDLYEVMRVLGKERVRSRLARVS